MNERAVKKYIADSWEKALTELKTPTFSLPYSFVPPCVNGEFRVLYYWDTYFTNVGLIADGRADLALNNVNNLLYVLELFGCVPNCAKENGAAYASQPPLLGLMIQDVYRATQDGEWLESAVRGLEKEYAFWMRKRMTAIGLNQYGGNTEDERLLSEYYDYITTRLPLPTELLTREKAERAKNFLAEGESGEDFTPRYARHNALDYVQIDLNAHLYGVESFLSEYYQSKDPTKSDRYRQNRERRLALLQKYCYDEETGIYFDYDFVLGKRSGVICAACFLPWFYGFGVGRDGLNTVFDRLFSGKACMLVRTWATDRINGATRIFGRRINILPTKRSAEADLKRRQAAWQTDTLGFWRKSLRRRAAFGSVTTKRALRRPWNIPRRKCWVGRQGYTIIFIKHYLDK